MVVTAIIGYLLGSLPTAVWVGKYLRIDPREHGDGNPGYWNMRGVVGERAALLVLLGDVAKGALAAAIGLAIWGPWWTAYVAVFFAMLGHAFPALAGLRGGRCVLTFVGAMAVIAPIPSAIALVVGVAVTAAMRNYAYGSRVAITAFPFVMLLFEPRSHVAVVGLLMTFIGLRFLVARRLAPASDERARALPA